MRLKKIRAKFNQQIGLFFLGKYLKYKYYNKKTSSFLNERAIEYEFVLENLLKHNCLTVLDVGTGSNSFSSVLEHCGYNVTATDLKHGNYWSTFTNSHIHVVTDDITNSKLVYKYDAVLCISVLEHIPNYINAVNGMAKKLKDNGILIMTFPYSYDNYCKNVYELPEADDIAKKFKFIGQSFSENEIKIFCKNFELELIDTKYAKGWSGKLWRTGDRYKFPIIVEHPRDANIGCFLFKKL